MIKNFKKWIFSLQGKFILAASGCMLIFTAIGSFVILSREKDLYRKDIINQGKVLAEMGRIGLTNVLLYSELDMIDKQDFIDYLDYFIMNLMEQDKRIQYVVIVDSNKKVIAHSDITQYGKLWKGKAIVKSLNNLKTTIIERDFWNNSTIDIATPLSINTRKWGSFGFGLSTTEVQKIVFILRREILFLIFPFSIASLIIISIGAGILSKPVVRLSKIMDSIKTHGDLEFVGAIPKLPLFKDRRDELGDLQKSFLWMIQRLRDADTERQKTMELLGQTEKMVSIGRLASGVAHEINNPLAGITLCFKNLVENSGDALTKEKLIMTIEDSLQKIKNVVGQLLDFSRMAATEKSLVNLNLLISRLLILIGYTTSKKNIEIISELSENIPAILIDENKMAQVLINIIINALQSMDSSGILTIKTELKNGFCILSIKDTGNGIPPDIMPNIFDPFFTTKGVGEGTGLGLSVSKGIVEEHNGIIEVDSKIGAGTTFEIKLPIQIT